MTKPIEEMTVEERCEAFIKDWVASMAKPLELSRVSLPDRYTLDPVELLAYLDNLPPPNARQIIEYHYSDDFESVCEFKMRHEDYAHVGAVRMWFA